MAGIIIIFILLIVIIAVLVILANNKILHDILTILTSISQTFLIM